MDKLIDNGKIISKKIIEIKKNHNATMIYKRLQLIACKQLLNLLKHSSWVNLFGIYPMSLFSFLVIKTKDNAADTRITSINKW